MSTVQKYQKPIVVAVVAGGSGGSVGDGMQQDMEIPYTAGEWRETVEVEVELRSGSQVLSFAQVEREPWCFGEVL